MYFRLFFFFCIYYKCYTTWIRNLEGCQETRIMIYGLGKKNRFEYICSSLTSKFVIPILVHINREFVVILVIIGKNYAHSYIWKNILNWPVGLVVSAPECKAKNHGFDSHPGHTICALSRDVCSVSIYDHVLSLYNRLLICQNLTKAKGPSTKRNTPSAFFTFVLHT